MAAQPVVQAGALPGWLLDQTDVFIDTEGYQHDIDTLPREAVLWFMDYLLANARKVRDMWSSETREAYDPDLRARRWMLERPVMFAFMRRAIELEDKARIEAALDSYVPQWDVTLIDGSQFRVNAVDEERARWAAGDLVGQDVGHLVEDVERTG